MAHLVQQMAYVGTEPWHGLGNRLPAKQPLDVWQREAGMDCYLLRFERLEGAASSSGDATILSALPGSEAERTVVLQRFSRET